MGLENNDIGVTGCQASEDGLECDMATESLCGIPCGLVRFESDKEAWWVPESKIRQLTNEIPRRGRKTMNYNEDSHRRTGVKRFINSCVALGRSEKHSCARVAQMSSSLEWFHFSELAERSSDQLLYVN